MTHARVMLVRRAPEAGAVGDLLDCLDQWAVADGSGLIFFHADAVLWPDRLVVERLPVGSLQLVLCSASWQRRRSGPPPDPFVLGSLVQFWHAVAQADQVCSMGVGGHD